MTPVRVRVHPDTPETGAFSWSAGGGEVRTWRPGDAPLAAECLVVLPSERVTIQAVDIPAAQADRIGGSLRFLIEDRMVSEPERTHVASVRAARERLCLAVIDREWFQAALARLRQAGLAPQAAYPECLLAPCASGTWTVVCGADEAFARTGPWAGFALGRLDRTEPPVALRLALQEGVPQRIVVRTAQAAPAPDAEAWSRALGAPVQAGAPWDWTRDWAPAIDLLQGEFAPRAARGGKRGRLRRTAMLAALAIAVFSTGIALEWFHKSRERARLIAEMREIHRETFGDTVPAVDPPAQMRQALAELRRRSGKAVPGDFVALLSAAFNGALDRETTRIHHMSYDGASLTLVVHPFDEKRISGAAALPGFEITTEPAEWAGQPTLRVKLRAREPGWTRNP